jgi:multidrug efflux pump subunit AcrB
MFPTTRIPVVSVVCRYNGLPPDDASGRNPLARFSQRFEAGFVAVRQRYYPLLRLAVGYPVRFVVGFLAVVALSLGPTPGLGQNFVPAADAGRIKLHVRARTGTRIDETARSCDKIEQPMHQIIPQRDLGEAVDNIDLPVSGANMADNNLGTIGPEDADTYVPGYRPTRDYVRALRNDLPQQLPVASFAVLPADIITPILNFRAPVGVQVIGPDQAASWPAPRCCSPPSATVGALCKCFAEAGRSLRPRRMSHCRAAPLAAVPRLRIP